MPRKKKKGIGELPSGQVRLKVYDYSEPVFDAAGDPVIDPKTGKQKIRKVYKSITADSLKEAQILKSEFLATRKTGKRIEELTVGQAMDKYIELSSPSLSPTTIQGYQKTRSVAFQDLMDVPLNKLTPAMVKTSVAMECKRKPLYGGNQLSAKTIHNEYGLLSATLHLYHPDFHANVTLPQIIRKQHDISSPDQIFRIVQGDWVELPVLLAMWLSFTMSEIKGLTKSKSISKDGQYISIVETAVIVDGEVVRKDTAKQPQRRRQLRIPPYIQDLIAKVETDELVPYSHHKVSQRFIKLIDDAGLPHMTFHDLRHVNASVMAFLGEDKVPAQYARARGGWASDHIMRGTYMQLYDRKRKEVDDNIDAYFSDVLKISTDPVDALQLFKQLHDLPEEKFIDLMNEYVGSMPFSNRQLHLLKDLLAAFEGKSIPRNIPRNQNDGLK